jgi:protein TonB
MLEIEKNPSPEIPAEVRPLPSHQIVSLADPIAQNFNSPSTQRYSAQTATLDSVAQFRAANRAAHRRQQQMKAFYTVVTIAVLAAGFVWFRSGNHPQIDAQMEKIHVSTPAAAQPAPVTAVTPAIQTVVRKPQAAVNAAAPVAPAPVAAEPTQAAAAPAQAADADVDSEAQPTQVVVRHGAISETLRKPRQADEEEQPLALPLKSAAAAGAPKPELLSSVVAPIPGKNPVLAVSAPKKFVPARLMRSVSAQYPPVARQMHAEGTVILEVEIDAAGNVASAKASSGPPLLRAAAVDAVQRWKYVPATLGDKPVASGQQVKVDFRLH